MFFIFVLIAYTDYYFILDLRLDFEFKVRNTSRLFDCHVIQHCFRTSACDLLL